MSNFKIGEKVVCVIFDNYCFDTNEYLPAPKKDEMVTIDWISKDGLKIGFEEYSSDDCWDSKNFRKLDHSFGEKICAEILESIKVKEEQLN